MATPDYIDLNLGNAPLYIAENEFLVNTNKDNVQRDASVSSLTNGHFVVTWETLDPASGDSQGIAGKVYDITGLPVTGEFLVNGATNGEQSQASVTGLVNGGFVVTWRSKYSAMTSDYDVFGRVFDDSGNNIGSEFLINTNDASAQYQPKVTELSDGGFVVSWTSSVPLFDGSSATEIVGQRFDLYGNKVGNDFLINSFTEAGQNISNISTLKDGGFIVVWDTYERNWGLVGQRFDSSGTKVDSEFRVNTNSSRSQTSANVTSLDNGGFVIVWQGRTYNTGDRSLSGISGQRFDRFGNKEGIEFRVNTNTFDKQTSPNITGLPDGGFIATWASKGVATGDGSVYGIVGQRYDASGNESGTEFLINTNIEGSQEKPGITTLADGSFVVTWQSLDPATGDNESFGIASKIFRALDAAVTVDVLANDIDVGTGGNVSNFSLDSVSLRDGDLGYVRIINNQLVFDAGNDFHYLQSGQSTEVMVDYVMTDDQGITSSSTVTITVYGKDNSETYYFNLGEGSNTIEINAFNEPRQLIFGEGITPAQLYFFKVGDDLQLMHFSNGDSLTAINFFLGEQHQIDQFIFSDGQNLSFGGLVEDLMIDNVETTTGSQWNDILRGSINNDVLEAHAGNDIVSGMEGDDTLYGGGGNDYIDGDVGQDTLYGGAGDDHLFGGTQSDLLEGGEGHDSYHFNIGDGWDTITINEFDVTESIVFGIDITPDNIILEKVGNNLQVVYGNNGVMVVDHFLGEQYQIDRFVFADGQDLSFDDLNSSAPIVLTPLNDISVNQDAGFNYVVPADSFIDFDLGDSLAYTATLSDGGALPTWLSFDAATQTFSGTPENGDVGDISLTVTATDNDGLTVSDNFNLTVNNVNDLAIVSSADDALDETDTPLSANGVLTSTDIDNTDNVFTVSNTVGTIGIFAIDAAGSWTFTANSTFDSLNVGESVDETYDVTSEDGTPSTVKITINGTNDAAVISSDTITLTGSDVLLTTSGMLTSSDVDNIDNIFTPSNTVGTLGSFDIDVSGNWTFTANSTFDNLNVGESVNETYNVTSIDGTTSTVDITINGIKLRQDGTLGDDTLVGQLDKVNVLYGGAGIDNLYGGQLSDTLHGGDDADTLFGNYGEGLGGNDTLIGGNGDDVIVGGGGADILFGDDVAGDVIGDGNDTMIGNDGDDTMIGGAGDDIMLGDDGADLAGDGADTMLGGAGADTLLGSGGNDIMFGNDGNDTLAGGEGNDILFGNNGDDDAASTVGENTLVGEAGDDIIIGGQHRDFIGGGTGNDYLEGRQGDDIYFFEDDFGQDILNDSLGSDYVSFSNASSNQLWFWQSNDDLNIGVINTDDKLTVQNWYVDDNAKVEAFGAAADGSYILEGQVQKLVEAMASYSAPSGGSLDVPQEMQDDVQSVIAASWQAA